MPYTLQLMDVTVHDKAIAMATLNGHLLRYEDHIIALDAWMACEIMGSCLHLIMNRASYYREKIILKC